MRAASADDLSFEIRARPGRAPVVPPGHLPILDTRSAIFTTRRLINGLVNAPGYLERRAAVALLVTDDGSNSIWRVSYAGSRPKP